MGVHDVGVTVLDQPIEPPQRVPASASGTEAITSFREPMLKDRFDGEPDRLLDVVAKRAGRDAILDRGHPQRPRLAIARLLSRKWGNVRSPDGLRLVVTRPQGRRQLGKIVVLRRREPLDALPVHTGILTC